MNNKDKEKLKKGLPVYLVFLFLIIVLGYVIYAQNKESGEQEQIPGEVDNHQSHKHIAESEDREAALKVKENSEKVLSLAQIISDRKTWDAIEPQLYGQKAPNFTVKGLEGKDITLSQFAHGKEVVLVFWATWCGFCVQEIPHLNKLTEEMSDEAKILAISDESPATVNRFAKDREIKYQLATAERGYKNLGSLYVKATRYGRPTAMHVDKNGNIKIIYVGAPSYQELKNIVKAEK